VRQYSTSYLIKKVELLYKIKIMGEKLRRVYLQLKKTKRTHKVGLIPYSVGRTSDITKAIKSQLLSPKEILYTKITNGDLIRRLKKAKGEGLLYILLDKSGSMRGEKDIFAKSVAYSLYLLNKAKYRIIIQLFDDKPRDLVDSKEAVKEYQKKLFNIFALEPDGGTNIALSMQFAINKITKEREKGTIVLISDGISFFDPKIKEKLKEANIVFYFIFVGSEGDWQSESSKKWREIAKKSLKVEPTEEGGLRVLEAIGG